MLAKPGGVQHPSVGVEDPADGSSRSERLHARLHGVGAGVEHGHVIGMRRAGQQRAHEACVVMAVDTRMLEGQLVAGLEMAAPRVVPAQQRVLPGADDELVAGIVATAAEDGRMHGGQDVALEGAFPGEIDGRLQGVVGERRRLAHVLELGLAFDQPLATDQVGCVLERAEPVQTGLEPPPVVRRQAVGIELDAEPGVAATLLGEDLA